MIKDNLFKHTNNICISILFHCLLSCKLSSTINNNYFLHYYKPFYYRPFHFKELVRHEIKNPQLDPCTK